MTKPPTSGQRNSKAWASRVLRRTMNSRAARRWQKSSSRSKPPLLLAVIDKKYARHRVMAGVWRLSKEWIFRISATRVLANQDLRQI